MSVGDFFLFGTNVYQGMHDNAPIFGDLPVDLAVLKASLDRLGSLHADAGYGDSRTIIERDQLRNEITIMLRQLAYHVEDLCNKENDRTKIVLSGFTEMPSSRSSEPLGDPRITSVDHVMTGQLRVRYISLGRDVRSYHVRSAEKDTPDPDSWPTRTFPNAKDGALYENLTPGVVYSFQVRAFGRDGTFTDWSPRVDKMCT